MQRPDKFLRTEFQAPTRACTRRVARRIWKRFIHWVAIGAPRRDSRQRYGITENRVRLVRMHAQGWSSSVLDSSSTMQAQTGARADQACHHWLRQAHGRQAEQGRSCRVGHRGECQVVDDGDQERPQERLPNVIDASTKAIHQAVSLASEQRLEVARLLGTSESPLEGRLRSVTIWALPHRGEGKIDSVDVMEFRGKVRIGCCQKHEPSSSLGCGVRGLHI